MKLSDFEYMEAIVKKSLRIDDLNNDPAFVCEKALRKIAELREQQKQIERQINKSIIKSFTQADIIESIEYLNTDGIAMLKSAIEQEDACLIGEMILSGVRDYVNALRCKE